MTALSNQKEGFVVRLRMASTKVIDGVNELDALKREWDRMGYSSSLGNEDIVDENAGITNTNCADVIGTTLTAIEALLAAGHGTNLHKLLYKGKNG